MRGNSASVMRFCAAKECAIMRIMRNRLLGRFTGADF